MSNKLKSEGQYENYFDDEGEEIESKETPQTKKAKKDKSNLTKNKSKKEDFIRPDPPSVHRKLVKNVQELQEMDLEQLYAQPYTNSQLVEEGADENMEYYDSLEDLYKKYGEEGMDLELLDFENMPGRMSEPIEAQISLLEGKFEEDKENYDTLFKLIYLYRMTKETSKLKKMREYTQQLFPLSDDMWKEWIKDELEEKKDFVERYDLIKSHFEKALDDFHCNYF